VVFQNFSPGAEMSLKNATVHRETGSTSTKFAFGIRNIFSLLAGWFAVHVKTFRYLNSVRFRKQALFQVTVFSRCTNQSFKTFVNCQLTNPITVVLKPWI